MTSIPLGVGAYKRQFAGEPEVRLENRYVEKDPSNLREHLTLISRAGSSGLQSLAGGTNRGNYSKLGLLNSDLFAVQGHNLWRVSAATEVATQIMGTIAGDGFPYVTWMKGIGYEFLFISDGSTLQYFSEHAHGTWTLTGSVQEGMVIKIGATYYGWSATVEHGAPAGTVTNPYWALLASGGTSTAANNAQSLANMVSAILASGTPGTFSSTILTPNADVSMTATDKTLTATSVLNTSSGNIATTTPVDGGGAGAWGAATLTGGGGTTLQTVAGLGAGEVSKALATVSGYVLVSVGTTQKFYWLNPGETVIQPLNFAEKESNPDNILDLLTVGDQVFICGNGSTETWYATGNFAAPFAPIEGRVYARGVIEGTLVNVNDDVMLVGNDGIVYRIGAGGVTRISNHGIEERVRTQLRFEGLLSP